MRVKCHAQEHNTLSLAKDPTWSRDKRTNHEGTAPPTSMNTIILTTCKIKDVLNEAYNRGTWVPRYYYAFSEKLECLFVLSLRARHCVTWLALRMIIIPWFDHQKESFSCKEDQFQTFCPSLKTSCLIQLKTLMKLLVMSCLTNVFSASRLFFTKYNSYWRPLLPNWSLFCQWFLLFLKWCIWHKHDLATLWCEVRIFSHCFFLLWILFTPHQ